MPDDLTAKLIPHIQHILDILQTGQEANKELEETPARFAALLADRFVPRARTRLRALASNADAKGPIVVRDIPFHALCAHHIVPFFGSVHIAYLPDQHIAGFGAFPRLVDELSRGPRIQEDLTQAIADAIVTDLHPKGVLIHVQARQMCMELTQACGAPHTVTWAANGCYDDQDIAHHAQAFFHTMHS